MAKMPKSPFHEVKNDGTRSKKPLPDSKRLPKNEYAFSTPPQHDSDPHDAEYLFGVHKSERGNRQDW